VHGTEPKNEPEHVQRWQWITDRHPGIQVIIGEYGYWTGYPGHDAWLHMLQAYDALLSGTNVMVALYTLTTAAGGWGWFDFSETLEALVGYWQRSVC
jgi:hypothetical protein